MSNFSTINTENWYRKEQFLFFKNFEEPFFGVTVHVDVTNLFEACRSSNVSFFTSYLHSAMFAINEIDEMKYRIHENGNVLLYHEIHASATMNREDHTFGFSFIKYNKDITLFNQNVLSERLRIQNSSNLFPESNGADCVHISTLPWLSFSSLSHARYLSVGDSVPKISFGKVTNENGKLTMPVSIHVHHALCDGYHVGLFVEKFQKLLFL